MSNATASRGPLESEARYIFPALVQMSSAQYRAEIQSVLTSRCLLESFPEPSRDAKAHSLSDASTNSEVGSDKNMEIARNERITARPKSSAETCYISTSAWIWLGCMKYHDACE